MDDYSTNVLSDSKNEWSIILMNYIVPHIIDGIRSIFNESVQICNQNDEEEKYLMTFQNLLSRVVKWNQNMIEDEKNRILKLANCSYLEDIVTAVHIIQLKILSAVRVGTESKKINIDIPDLGTFIHNSYINVARKLYSNIYLFEVEIPPLEIQKRNREFELLVQTCIMNTIREKIPIETLLRQYIDETQEIEITKVERVVDTKPMEMPKRIEPKIEAKIPYVEENLPINFTNNTMDNSEFKIKETIFDIPEPRVGFSDKNSVLEFESPKDDNITLGDPITNLDFEDLDLSKSNEVVDLKFEEL